MNEEAGIFNFKLNIMKKLFTFCLDITAIPAYCLGYICELNKDAFLLGKHKYNSNK